MESCQTKTTQASADRARACFIGRPAVRIGAALAAAVAATPALAQAQPGTIDAADTAWMIVATGLVLMMTIPGLALFYCGMVRKKNVLATMAPSLLCVMVCSLPPSCGFSFPLEAMEETGKSKTGEAGRKVLIARADARAAQLAPIVADLRRGGIASWYGIAMALNKRGIPTASGRGIWEPAQVRRMMDRAFTS